MIPRARQGSPPKDPVGPKENVRISKARRTPRDRSGENRQEYPASGSHRLGDIASHLCLVRTHSNSRERMRTKYQSAMIMFFRNR